jgi:hypothetical protein
MINAAAEELIHDIPAHKRHGSEPASTYFRWPEACSIPTARIAVPIYWVELLLQGFLVGYSRAGLWENKPSGRTDTRTPVDGRAMQ